MHSKTVSRTTQSANPSSRDRIMRGIPQPHLLQNKQLSTVISTTSAGGLFFDDLAITRWRADPTADAKGYFIYLRDLDNGNFWSAGYQPTLKTPDEIEVQRFGQTVEFSRSDHQIHTTLKVCLALDENVELRSCTLVNQSPIPRRIELTSYAELVLQCPQADSAHPAFSKLFIETERLESGLLLARRRPRQAGELLISAAHFLAGCGEDRTCEYETDRCRFIGRGRDLHSPQALVSSHPLSGASGSVLDPIFSLRKVLYLPPTASACVTFAIAASQSEEELPAIASRFENPISVEKTLYTCAKTNDRTILRTSGSKQWRLDTADKPTARMPRKVAAPSNDTPELPALDASLTPAGNTPQKNTPPPPQATATDHTQNADAMLLQAEQKFAEQLQFDNGLGGFSEDGTEYIIRVGPRTDNSATCPPMPWVNIIANPNAGFIVSESGAGYTWAGNSRLNRLTPWQNDPVRDPHSEALYIRDNERGIFWSPTPGPVTQDCIYEVRHGFGYTKFRHTSHQIRQEVLQFMPREDAVKITCVRLQNLSTQTRHLSLFSYHQWQLGDGCQQDPRLTHTTICPEKKTIFATNSQQNEYANHVAYASLSLEKSAGEQHFSGDRQEFLGQNGRLANPLALQNHKPLSGNAGNNLDPCAACQAAVEILPGETLEYVVLLGQSPTQNEADRAIERYQSVTHCRQALSDVQDFWRNKLSAVQIKTPSPAIDLLVNGWLPYQNLSCRLWGRSSTYQSGGAYGFRDQLQDAAALIHHWPQLTRDQILRNAAHQFAEGDVLHWWHPPSSQGIRTKFSDDLLWLPLFAAEYVDTTGDDSLWVEDIRFLSGPTVPAGEPEMMLSPSRADESGTVYEHCCLALDRGLTLGAHGLPLMGCGDWNDGMNRVGQAGRGESVWLGFFIHYILNLMLPVCERFKDHERLRQYRKYQQQLRVSLNDTGWDGEWYLRAYFDDGSPLGTATGKECQIDALVQAWAVLSGAAPTERASQALDAATDRLVDEQAGLIRLLDPPFDQMPEDPGYIKGYLPGIRENGGQYTHGVLWFIRAAAKLGRGTQAVKLLEMLSPINHSRNASEVSAYQTEPYVVAADVYSQPPHVGRGGWSWYTGSAGWMFRVAMESILGIQLQSGNTLRIDPRISADWPECFVHYRMSDEHTCYKIEIQNPHRKQQGVTSAVCDGQPLQVIGQVAEIPLLQDGREHHVVVIL